MVIVPGGLAFEACGLAFEACGLAFEACGIVAAAEANHTTTYIVPNCTIKYKNIMSRIEEEKQCCPVCLQTGKSLALLPCSHSLCVDCMDQWRTQCLSASKRFVCPLCRTHNTHAMEGNPSMPRFHDLITKPKEEEEKAKEVKGVPVTDPEELRMIYTAFYNMGHDCKRDAASKRKFD